MNGLAALVKEQLQADPFSGVIFCFRASAPTESIDLLRPYWPAPVRQTLDAASSRQARSTAARKQRPRHLAREAQLWQPRTPQASPMPLPPQLLAHLMHAKHELKANFCETRSSVSARVSSAD
jgi:hypothetical protein